VKLDFQLVRNQISTIGFEWQPMVTFH